MTGIPDNRTKRLGKLIFYEMENLEVSEKFYDQYKGPKQSNSYWVHKGYGIEGRRYYVEAVENDLCLRQVGVRLVNCTVEELEQTFFNWSKIGKTEKCKNVVQHYDEGREVEIEKVNEFFVITEKVWDRRYPNSSKKTLFVINKKGKIQ